LTWRNPSRFELARSLKSNGYQLGGMAYRWSHADHSGSGTLEYSGKRRSAAAHPRRRRSRARVLQLRPALSLACHWPFDWPSRHD
jgi:hypothetical protein